MASRTIFAAGMSVCGAALLLVGACGKVDDPKNVEVSKLKPAMRLQAIPSGCTSDTDCSITLSWSANNNEDDFSGYNIYMSETAPATLASEFSLSADSSDPQALTPIQFQDANGDDIKTVKATLAKYFNIDPTTKKNTDNSTEAKYNPLVRCNVKEQDKGGTCVAITEADDSHEETRANGYVSYVVSGLTKGAAYSFFVAATMDSGKKAVFPATNVMWARTRGVTSLTYKPKEGNKFFGHELAEAGFSGDTYVEFDRVPLGSYCTTTNENADGKKPNIYWDTIGSEADAPQAIVGAFNTRIADLGAVVAGNGDLWTSSAPGGLVNGIYRLWGTALIPALDPSGIISGPKDLGVKAGYSVCGESIPLYSGHLYSIAIPQDPGSPSGKYRYALLSYLKDSETKIDVVVGKGEERKL